MSVKIRLARVGTRKKPYYRIVVCDSERPRNGKFIEIVGTYNPKKGDAKTTWNAERIRHWLKVGAKPTQTVGQLMAREMT